MMIQFDVRVAPKGFSYWSPERKIGNKMSVHYVDMQHFDSSGLDTAYIFAEAHEICRKDGWKNLDHYTNPAPVRNGADSNSVARRASQVPFPQTNIDLGLSAWLDLSARNPLSNWLD
jgi:hypothetical protein